MEIDGAARNAFRDVFLAIPSQERLANGRQANEADPHFRVLCAGFALRCLAIDAVESGA